MLILRFALTLVIASTSGCVGAPNSPDHVDDEFAGIDTLGIEIHCPNCGNEMANDGNSLTLAEAPCGAMLECGNCQEVTSWRFSLDPFDLRQIPNEWGGRIECPGDPAA